MPYIKKPDGTWVYFGNGVTPHIGDNGNWWIGNTDTGVKADASGDYIPLPPTASVGQTIVVKEVDDAGKPTSWELVDLPEQSQSNWSQNDSSAADYVKNRPFYSENTEITVENVIDVKLNGFPYFKIGDTVTVNVDGVEYSLVAFDDDGATIGDSFDDVKNGTGQYGWQIYYDGSFYATEFHTVSYYCETVHKIDKKYIPNYNSLCFDYSTIFFDYEKVTTLSDGAIVYSCSPSIDFYGIPYLGIMEIDCIGLAKLDGGSSTFVAIMHTQMNESGVSVKCRVFVHYDNIEQGIADYKKYYGIA